LTRELHAQSILNVCARKSVAIFCFQRANSTFSQFLKLKRIALTGGLLVDITNIFILMLSKAYHSP
jgi:hypothetical protein